MVIGNPARHVGWVSQYGNKLEFDKSGFAICNDSKEKYFLSKNKVKEYMNKVNVAIIGFGFIGKDMHQ